MATSQEDNPNSSDLPAVDQQVMSPSVATTVEAGGPTQRPVVNGLTSQPQGFMNMDGEVTSVRRGQGVEEVIGDGVEARQRGSSAPVGGDPASFLMTGAAMSSTVSSGQNLRSPPAGPSVRERAQDVGFRPKGSSSTSILSGVMRAVSSIPGVVEDAVTRPLAPTMRSAGTSQQEMDGYLSAQSWSPGDQRRPPSEGQVPATPLFDQRTMNRLNEMPTQAPLLYATEGMQNSTGRASSTHSSDIQAEVRRQLSEFMALHEDESLRLRRQVEELYRENQELKFRASNAKSSPFGLEGTGLPGLGWFGRGLGSILGSTTRHGTPHQAPDFGPSRSPAPPPPPPPPETRSLDFAGQHYHTQGLDSDHPPLPSIATQESLSQNRANPPLSRSLFGDPGPPAPIASPKPPPTSSFAAGHPPSAPLDPLSVVLTGMAQLQGVVSEMAGTPKASSRSEVIKPGVTTLPDLPAPSLEACLEFSDWLHNSRPALADVSDSSEELWELVVQEAGIWYSEYLRKGPLDRLTMKPTPSSAVAQPKWTRVARRIETMIIGAAPQQIRDELSAARVSGLLQALCRLFVIYAPGGLTEREIGLKQIQEPSPASTPKEAVHTLRRWQRWCARMKELGGVLPDCALRVKALERVTKNVLVANPDIGFRINLTRAALQIDSIPDDSKVEQLHAQLLSELEVVSHRAVKEGERSKDNTNNPVVPKVRGVETETAQNPPKNPKASPKTNPKNIGAKPGVAQDQSASGKPQCTFYLGANGCKKGLDCAFEHNWGAIPAAERSGRCKSCGARLRDIGLQSVKPVQRVKIGQGPEPRLRPLVPVPQPLLCQNHHLRLGRMQC